MGRIVSQILLRVVDRVIFLICSWVTKTYAENIPEERSLMVGKPAGRHNEE